MLGSIGSIILLIIIIGCIVYWFVLKKQIDEEENDRIEPHIDGSFSEFSQKELPKNHDFDDQDDYIDEEIVLPTTKYSTEPVEPAVNPTRKAVDEELFEIEERAPKEAYEAPKKSFFARFKENFAGDKDVSDHHADDHNLARPAVVRTVALILKAPDDQPYLGQEVLEVGKELKLMIGGSGFLQQLVTTYTGDEPMYSIAHMKHPGSFDDPEILDTEIPGLLFFAQIPGPDSQMNTVQCMLKGAAFFGQELGGTLLDENQRPVDQNYVQALLGEVGELEQKSWAKHRIKR